MTVATAKNVHISDLHFEMNLWLNELKFRKSEIGIFNNRMEEIVSRSEEQEFMRQLEHFQNQYIREHEVIDELRHDIKQHENILEKEETAIVEDDNVLDAHSSLREQMDQFRKIYYELRNEFFAYLQQWI